MISQNYDTKDTYITDIPVQEPPNTYSLEEAKPQAQDKNGWKIEISLRPY